MPASTCGVRRCMSTTRFPAIASYTCLRRASVASSVEPCRRNLMLSRTARLSCLRDSWPALYEARAKWKAEEPSMSVLSRSKKAAPRAASAAIDFEDDRVALATTRADRGHAEPATAATQLVHQRAEDARARCADRVAERDRAAVHVHLRLVETEHPHRIDRHRRER